MYSIPLSSSWENADCLVPGPNGKVISLKGSVVNRDKFEALKEEYYQLRGWDVGTGLQKVGKLEELELHEVAQELSEKGLAI